MRTGKKIGCPKFPSRRTYSGDFGYYKSSIIKAGTVKMTKIWLKNVKNQCNYALSWQCTPLLIKRDRQAFSLDRLCYLKLEMDSSRDGQNFFSITTFCLIP